jgi:mRNA interferase MazF
MRDLREKEYHRGDVFMADLGDGFGSEQGGKRPVVIFQNNTGCYFSPAVTIVPFTATIKKPNLVTHYIVRRTSFLKHYSMALAEQIRTIDKHRLVSYMGRMSPKDLGGVAEAVEAHLGFDLPESIEAP